MPHGVERFLFSGAAPLSDFESGMGFVIVTGFGPRQANPLGARPKKSTIFHF